MEIQFARASTHRRSVFCRIVSATLFVAGCLSGPSRSPAQETLSPARLTFTKVLKGSVPEYLAITVDTTGSGTYEGRKTDDSPDARPLKLSPATTRRLFQLAGQLNNFQSIDLESHRKVANLGWKTLVYESGGRENKAEFNYTLRRDAQELVDLFEKIATVEQHIAALEFAIKYDHLTLPKELLQIQIDLQHNALADPERMVPALEQIVRDRRFLHLAQVRAQTILERLQSNN